MPSQKYEYRGISNIKSIVWIFPNGDSCSHTFTVTRDESFLYGDRKFKEEAKTIFFTQADGTTYIAKHENKMLSCPIKFSELFANHPDST